jgi:hypothetical protein
MHFHLPKPLHGWRELAGEVGIIVVGILIALAGEQLVEEWRWHRQLGQANVAFKGELANAAGFGYERLAVKRCLQARLAEIAGRLNGSETRWRAMPERFNGAGKYYFNVLPVVYRPPNRNMQTDAWRNALADGTINHLRSERAATLSAAYTAVDEFMRLEREESDAQTRLGPLGLDRPIDTRTRTEMLQTVAQLDRLNDRVVNTSGELLDYVRQSGLGFTRAEADALRGKTLAVQRDYRGGCVEAPRLSL